MNPNDPLSPAPPSITFSLPMSDKAYAHPEVLVGTDWVAEHGSDPGVRIIESNEDVLLYDTGHNIPRNELIKETLNWLDEYLGPVN